MNISCNGKLIDLTTPKMGFSTSPQTPFTTVVYITTQIVH